MRDARTTPFNIGRNIELKDFTFEEAKPFATALGSNGNEILQRVMHWSGGHPFLTQALCSELATSGTTNIDRLVMDRYLTANSRQSDTNLVDVSNRLLGRAEQTVDETILSNTLARYRVMRKRGIEDDDGNPIAARIKMSGIARTDNGRLYVRNRIYSEAFDPSWIKDNLPYQELRRQKKAFWRGAFRSGLVGTFVVSILTYLAFNNYRLLKKAEYETYVASMRFMPLSYQLNDFAQIDRTLDLLANSPSRGWEYGFWHRLTHRAIWSLSAIDDFHNNIPISPDGKWAATVSHDRNRVNIYDLDNPRIVSTIPLKVSGLQEFYLFFCDAGKLLEVYEPYDSYTQIRVYETFTGKLFQSRRFEGTVASSYSSELTPGHSLDFRGSNLCLLNLRTLENVPIKKLGREPTYPTLSPDGTKMGWIETGITGQTFAVCTRVSDWKELGRIHVDDAVSFPTWLYDSKTFLVPNASGNLSSIRFDREVPEILVLKLADDIASVQASPTKNQFTIVENGMAHLFDYNSGRPLLLRTYRDVFFCRFFPDGKSLLTVDDAICKQSTFGEPDVPEFSLKKTPWDRIQISQQGEARAWSAKLNLFQTLNTRSKVDSLKSGIYDTGAPFVFDQAGDASLRVDKTSGTASVFVEGPPHSVLTLKSNLNGVFAGNLSFDFNRSTGDVALKTAEREVSLFSQSGTLLGSIETTGVITSALISGDGRYLACGCRDGLSVWEVATRKMVWTNQIENQHRPIFGAFFSQDSQLVGVISSPGVGKIYDLRTGQNILTVGSRNQRATSGDFSADGKRLAIGTVTGAIKIYDCATGEPLSDLGTHPSSISDVKFIGRGDTLVSASSDGTIKVWKSDEKAAPGIGKN